MQCAALNMSFHV